MFYYCRLTLFLLPGSSTEFSCISISLHASKSEEKGLWACQIFLSAANLVTFSQKIKMEKGNEGDEIIFLSLRQIECPIPDDVVKVGQILPDLLVAIIARSLLLISDGEINVSLSLHLRLSFCWRL